jgi:hypothetical protein
VILRLPTVPDRHALTLRDDTMIAGGEVGPKTHQPLKPGCLGAALIPSCRRLAEFKGAQTISAIAEIAPARAF